MELQILISLHILVNIIHLGHLSQPLTLVVDAGTSEVSFPWRKIIDMNWICWINWLPGWPSAQLVKSRRELSNQRQEFSV